MKSQALKTILLVIFLLLKIESSVLAAQENTAPSASTKSDKITATTTAATASWLEYRALTGDQDGAFSGQWGHRRLRLKEHGITIEPRLTQFYQGVSSGDDDYSTRYGSKFDVLFNADLNKFGMWKGFSITTHSEYNFGHSLNSRGGTIAPINAALYFPEKDGNSFDISSFYLGQVFGDTAHLLVGKINIVDIAANKKFMGGAGIDSFWNATFVAPPSGTVPPYLFGALLSVRTKHAIVALWVYDPNNAERAEFLKHSFKDGFTIRPTVEFPVTIAGLSGHQAFTFAYSNKDGTDLGSVDDMFIPQWSGSLALKSNRYYGAYSFDQYLYQSKEDPQQGFGLFGQFGISDGNPNRLYWMSIIGLGGRGLIPRRSRDNWGMGYYYAAISPDLKDSLEPALKIKDEQGMEIFYNFVVSPWFDIGLDLQVIKPSLEEDTAIISGVRTVLRF